MTLFLIKNYYYIFVSFYLFTWFMCLFDLIIILTFVFEIANFATTPYKSSIVNIVGLLLFIFCLFVLCIAFILLVLRFGWSFSNFRQLSGRSRKTNRINWFRYFFYFLFSPLLLFIDIKTWQFLGILCWCVAGIVKGHISFIRVACT